MPSIQKKTGAVAADMDSKHTVPVNDADDEKPKTNKKSLGTTPTTTNKKRKAIEEVVKTVVKKEYIKPEKKENLKPIANGRRRSGRSTEN